MKSARHEGGFTLLEVLVALVVAGILVAILANGAVIASQRIQYADQRAKNLLVAENVLEQALTKRPVIAVSGQQNGVGWTISVQPVAQDPRGTATLLEISVSAGSKNPVTLRRRLLVTDDVR